MDKIDKQLVKKSYTKLVVSGNTYELYKYEKPYFYNWPNKQREEETYQKKLQSDERTHFSIKRSRDKIRRLVNANVNAWGAHRSKFITYTFKDDITELKEARFYFAMYIRKVKYKYPNIKYLGVAEIQKQRYEKYGVKVWHFHVIFFNYPFVYGIKDEVAKMWTKGFIKVIATGHVQNYGAYVSKYLRKDLYEKELVGEKSFFTSKGLIQPKRYRKKKNVDKFFTKNNTVVQFTDQYTSTTLGLVTYQTGIINK